MTGAQSQSGDEDADPSVGSEPADEGRETSSPEPAGAGTDGTSDTAATDAELELIAQLLAVAEDPENVAVVGDALPFTTRPELDFETIDWETLEQEMITSVDGRERLKRTLARIGYKFYQKYGG